MVGAGVTKIGASLSCSGVVGADSMTERMEGKGSWVVCSICIV
jgi:hypothetical protein